MTSTCWSGEERRHVQEHEPRRGVLVVDTDAERGARHVAILQEDGLDASLVTTIAAAMEQSRRVLVVLTSLTMDGMSGNRFIERLHEQRRELPVLILASAASVDDVIGAVRAGACDYVNVPVDPSLLCMRVRRAFDLASLSQDIDRLQALKQSTTSRFTGSSPTMGKVRDLIERVAHSDVTVLVHGETGTGKELVARSIHEGSARAAHPFVGINCAAVSPTLLESELFGHVRGAYTDAKTARDGIFVQATGGTLFLDEIGDMALEMQSRLLRALQERRIRPVGGNVDVEFDTRVISATHHDLEKLVAAGRFREDLYYRVNVVTIDVPPLRERGNDVIELASQILARAAVRERRAPCRLSPQVAERLLAYDWAGNVRELENCMERVIALARTNEISVEDLPDRVRHHRSDRVIVVDDRRDIVTLEVLEKRYIHHVIKLLDGNKAQAADLLGIDRRTLYRRLEKYDAGEPGRPVGSDVTNGHASGPRV